MGSLEELINHLSRLPGIGKKTAQRIVLELKDKLAGAALGDDVIALPNGVSAPWRDSVHSALLGLGYSAREADDALVAISEDAIARKVGARGLKIILEELMLDVMYQVPSRSDVTEIVVTREVVERRVAPLASMKKAV